MSADEIRRLAESIDRKGCRICGFASDAYYALLAYAEMVERCEEERRKYVYAKGVGGLGKSAWCDSHIGLIDRIMKGATNA